MLTSELCKITPELIKGWRSRDRRAIDVQPRPRPSPDRARIRKNLHNVCANSSGIDFKKLQNLDGQRIHLAEDPEKDMLGANVVVPEAVAPHAVSFQEPSWLAG